MPEPTDMLMEEKAPAKDAEKVERKLGRKRGAGMCGIPALDKNAFQEEK